MGFRLAAPLLARSTAALCTIVLSACYFQNREVQLSEPLGFPTVVTVGGGMAVTLARPLDARPNPALIGDWRSSMGVHQVARPRGDVAVWVGNSFASGLERAGFNIQRSESTSQSATPLALLITVKEAYTTFARTGFSAYIGEARIVAQVELYRDGQPIWKRIYSGTAPVTTGGSDGPESDAYRRALQEAMQKMLNTAIPNLAGALAKEAT